EGVETDLGGRVVAGVEPVLVERLLERVDLRPGGGRLGLADLPEVARRDVADEQPDDGHHDQQLEQGEAARTRGEQGPAPDGANAAEKRRKLPHLRVTCFVVLPGTAS